MITIAMLGNAVHHANRLHEKLAVAHEILSEDASRLRSSPQSVDVGISLAFARHDAQRWRFRLLQVPGAGLDGIDFAALPHDCAVCNVHEHEGPIAEFVLLAMLDHVIGFRRAARDFDPRDWANAYRTRPPHGELAGKTVGIVGFGHIGREIARRAAAFGMRVVAVTRTPPPNGAAEHVAWIKGTGDLNELLREADFVVLACPLSAATRGLIGAPQLHAMKRSALLVNVARGEVTVEEDLYLALKDGIIAGAALDVWYRYPRAGETDILPSRFPFHELSNVACTPHVSGWTDSLFERRYDAIARNIERLAAGEPLRNVVVAPSWENHR